MRKRHAAALLAAAILSTSAAAIPAQARTTLPHSAVARWSSENLATRASSHPLDRTRGPVDPRTLGELPSAPVGHTPQSAAFDPATQTVYIANQDDNTVSVLDARHCNARDTSGCATTPPTIAIGAAAFSMAINPATHSVNVPHANDDAISVIDAAPGNGRAAAGCAKPLKTLAGGPGPLGIAVDASTDTVYVADSGGTGNTVAVLNGA